MTNFQRQHRIVSWHMIKIWLIVVFDNVSWHMNKIHDTRELVLITLIVTFIDWDFYKKGKFSLVNIHKLKKQHITILVTQHYLNYLTFFQIWRNWLKWQWKLINRRRRKLTRFNNFMKQIAIWDYSSISRDSYLALSCEEKEKLVKSYYLNMKKTQRWLV